MATADRMFYAGLNLPVQWWILYRIAVLSVSATEYTCTDKVCSALRYKNIDPLGSRHEYTGGFPREMSVTNTWCMLVGSYLQYRDASAIWFVNHRWRLTSSTLISVWPCCTPGPQSNSTWCSASDGVSTKAGSQWPAGEDHQAAFATSGSTRFTRMPTTYRYLLCALCDRQGSRSGATVQSDYATTTTTMMMMMKDVKLVSKMEGKTIFFESPIQAL